MMAGWGGGGGLIGHSVGGSLGPSSVGRLVGGDMGGWAGR